MLRKSKKIICLAFIIISISTILYPLKVWADDEEEEELSIQEVQEQIVESSNDVSAEPTISSRAAVVFDRTTGQLVWGKNENEQRAMASTTKIMTSIVILEKCNLTDTVVVSKKAAGTGGSRLKINTGDKITVNDLLYGLMMRSGNDAAVALAEHAGGSVEGFATLMNQKAQELGLTNTHFVTPHGLDDENHYTTAYELAKLTDYALNNKKLTQIVGTKKATIHINGVARDLYNTNELLGVLNGVDGVKTGFTGNAGRCLVTSCTRQNHQYITVVLGADTKKQRTADSTKLIEYAFKTYEIYDLEKKVEEEFKNWNKINGGRIYINKAKQNKMEFALGELNHKKIDIKKGEEDTIQVQIECLYSYQAPIEAGTRVGIMTIKRVDPKQVKKEEIIETVPIFCEKTIEKRDISDYLTLFFKEYSR